MIGPLPSLDEIGFRHGTDKSSSKHCYLDFYQRFIGEMRHEPITVLEIGVYHGESIRMWAEFFPNATIIALDIDPDCLRHASERIKVLLADQSNIIQLLEVALQHGPFDLVLDDGSHMWNHQITTLRTLYPFVKPGRYYILEDIDTSYGGYVAQFQGVASVSAAKYLQRLCDYIVADAQLNLASEEDAFLRACAPITEFVAFKARTSILRRRPV